MDKKKIKKSLRKLLEVKKETIILLFLIGVLFLVICIPTSNKDGKAAGRKTPTTWLEPEEETEAVTGYQEKLEKKLENMLEAMNGVGDAKVMITLSENVQEDSWIGNSKLPKVQGVLVVCKNGDDPSVRAEVLEAIMALFQIESHKISIVKASK